MVKQTLCAVAMAVLVAAPGGADTIKVSVDGLSGYSTIEAGLAAVAPGDSVLVHAGNYAGAVLHIDKSLVLLGAGADTTRYFGLFEALVITGGEVVVVYRYFKAAGPRWLRW